MCVRVCVCASLFSLLAHNNMSNYLKLHSCQFKDDITTTFSYHGPCDLVLGLLRPLHRLLGKVVEGHNVVQHCNCLVEWTVAVKLCVGVLL